MESTIIVIPAEGDAPETEIWYIQKLKAHYQKAEVLVFEHDYKGKEHLNVFLSTVLQVRRFVAEHYFTEAEIHAQGGLGALVAYEFLRYCPERIATVFMVGGAPSGAMTGIAKLFHRVIVRGWYHLQWFFPFFADDPNPENDEDIAQIKASSTEVMRRDPLLYRNQLILIGGWGLSEDWQVPAGCQVYFVPNGKTVRPIWWDNTYDSVRARELWREHGVLTTPQPGKNFSFYSMMPACELFEVMDNVR